MTRLTVIFAVLLAGCGPDLPDFDARISAESRNSVTFARLEPLAPVLADLDETPPRDAAQAGLGLEAQAADLRRRAALLRQQAR